MLYMTFMLKYSDTYCLPFLMFKKQISRNTVFESERIADANLDNSEKGEGMYGKDPWLITSKKQKTKY